MSAEEECRKVDTNEDPDYIPDFTTLDQNAEVCTVDSAEIQQDFDNRPKPKNYYVPKPKRDRRTSLIWTKFTLINRKDSIAACNICGRKLSTRSTSGNLRKHLERKHGYSIKSGVLPKKMAPKLITPRPNPKVSELAGVTDQGIMVKVVGENGEEEHYQVMEDEFMPGEAVQEHDYSTLEQQAGEDNNGVESEPPRIRNVRSLNAQSQSLQSKRGPPALHTPFKSATSFLDDTSKRRRIAELQLECLENKKYNMQLEALLMEQQLNLPRSIFTETLRYSDTQTRSTQTEVGGSDTKVFYVTNKGGGRPIQQLFAYHDLDL